MSDSSGAHAVERLRKNAKRWLSAIRDNNAEALARLQHILKSIPASITLRDVQHALALEHGFPGWGDMKRAFDRAA